MNKNLEAFRLAYEGGYQQGFRGDRLNSPWNLASTLDDRWRAGYAAGSVERKRLEAANDRRDTE